MKILATVSLLVLCYLTISNAQECPGQFQCSNGQCIPSSWVCDGVTDCQGESHPGSDEKDCPAATCASDEFQCLDGECIPQGFRCDSDADCSDGEDEQACPGSTCGSDEFTCQNRFCIPQSFQCDHVNDCSDSSDEGSDCSYETCSDRKCDNGACYTTAQRCDGTFDCRDESDEFNCTSIKCPSGQFQCDNGKCIPQSFVCDVWNNCGDRSDEPDTCEYPSCPGNTLTCDNGVCVNQDFVCDGIDNCGDSTDEKNCNYDKVCLNNQWKCSNSSNQCVNITQLCDGSRDCENGEDETQDGTLKICSSTNCGILSCDYRCRATPWGGACYCDVGMQVADDGISCEDFDECFVFGQCEQICENTVGSYKCVCSDGYASEMHDGHLHCKADPVDDAPRLLYSAGSNIISYDILNNREYVAVAEGVDNPKGVDYHFNKRMLFWADSASKKIMSSDMNGNNKKVVLEVAIQDPEQVAVDWIANNLYIIETSVSRIDACNFDGSHRSSIVTDGIEEPRGLALDPMQGYMFFTDWGNDNTRLDRAYMDGSEIYTLVDSNMGWPNGITLDFVSNRVYWVDGKFDYVETIDYNGKDRRTILSGSTTLPHPFDLTIFEDHIYITDWTRLGVLRANKFDGSDFSIYTTTGGSTPYGIVSYHPVRQPQVANPCEIQNGGCDHLCVLSHTSDNDGLGYKCLCDAGFTISVNGRTCSAVTSFLLLNSYNSIRGIPTGQFANQDVMLPILADRQTFVAVSADSPKGYVYFADSWRRIIQRRFVNGSDHPTDVVSNGMNYVRAMALDWAANNLYYVDGGRRVIGVVKLDTDLDLRKDLITDVSSAMAIAVHPKIGWMAWSQSGRPARIKTCWMDGTHISDLVNTTIGTPTDITIDLTTNRLYWVDTYFDRIEVISLYGFGRAQLKISPSLIYPTSITYFEDYVYYTDTRSKTLYRVHNQASNFPLNAEVVRQGIASATTMYYYDKNLQERYKSTQCNRPENPNGGCQQFCFPTPSNSRTCGCAYGFMEGVTSSVCIPDPHSTPPPLCTSSQYQCDNGRCIYNFYKCNAIDDCGDGSDEKDCGNFTCPSYRFRCDNGKCIYSSWKCDGDNDCGDNSDEKDCPPPASCHQNLFQCDNGKCVSKTWVCDSDNDCGDGSDEKDCEGRTCGTTQYTCPNNVCIPQYMRCNGVEDCNNGADEQDCPPKECNPSYLFACSSGTQCVSLSYRCDGVPDCTDGSDEVSCPSRPPGLCDDDEFQCQTSGICIPQSWWCDARKDCDDGSDEPPSCPPFTCNIYQFQCDNNICVSRYYKCNGNNDCGDNSDEKDCPTPPPTLPPPVCGNTKWQCPGYPGCISYHQLCNGVSDCPGSTDEGSFCAVNACNGFGCTDNCAQLPEGPLCWCNGDGYVLLNDSKTCADIDECSLNYCSQQCDNTEGSFFCKCDDGYRLDTDGRTCKVTSNDRLLMLSNRRYVYEYNLDTKRLRVPIYSSNVQALDFDWLTRKAYFADTTYGYIFSTYLNGTDRKPVFQSGQAVSENMAVDWVARNLYWTDYLVGSVEVVGLDGKHRVVLHSENVTNPRGIAIDPRDGYHYLFWTDWGQNPRIERSDMDGSHRQSIVSDDLYWPNGLAIDYPNKMVYFADAKLDFIHRCDYSGGQRTEVLAGDLVLSHPHSITVLEDTLFWTDLETRTLSQCNKWDGKKNQSTLITGLYYPSDVVAFHPVRQPSGTNYCQDSPCSHLCLLGNFRPRYYACACPAGSALVDDHTCQANDTDFLVVGTPGNIFGISLEPSDQTNDKMVPVTNVENGRDVEHDDTRGMIYWVDDDSGAIHQVHINGSMRGVFAASSTIGSPSALAVDWMSRNMYYTNPDGKSIEAIKMDRGTSGRQYRTVILGNIGNATGVGNPVGIAVDPLNGRLYWSDKGLNNIPEKISSCNLDGSDVKNIVTDGLNDVEHIALDIPARRIYWAQRATIKSAKYDGTDVRTIVSNVARPIGITVLDNYVYYTDYNLELIERADKTNGDGQVTMRAQIKGATALKIFNRPVGKPNPCFNNKQCGQFCFPVGPAGFTCACGTGYKLDTDNSSCLLYDSFVVVSQGSPVRGYDLEGNSHVDALNPIAGRYVNGSALDVDMSTKTLVWANYYPGGSYGGYFGLRYNALRAWTIDGSSARDLVRDGIGQLGITSIAMDWAVKNVYFINAFTSETFIEVVRTDKIYRVILLKTTEDQPRAIVVNPAKRYLYWSDYGQNPKIERAHLDASNRTIMAQSGVVSPRGLTVDYATHDIYWVDESASKIEKMSWDGRNRVTVRSGRNYPAPRGISIYKDKMYWIDYNWKSVFRASKDPANTDEREELRSGLDGLQALAIYDKDVQPSDENNPCVPNNGGCDQLCYPMPDNTKVCDCAYGKIGSNGVTCTDTEDYVIYSTTSNVASFHIDPLDHSQPFTPLSLPYPIALAYDREENRVYFSTKQGTYSKIGYFSLGDSTPRPSYVVTSGLRSPEGLDFDWVHKRLFYTDEVLNIIGAIGVDGRNSTVVMTGLDRPRGIAVDPCRGYVYWTDWGNPAKIERATLAGNVRTTIVGTDLYWPNGLTIDFDEDKLYWVDAQPSYERIERCNVDGTERTRVTMSYNHPFAISILDQFVYWSDWTTLTVYRANKEDGGSITPMTQRLTRSPMDVLTVSPRLQDKCKGYNPCNRFNGGCSHLCTIGPDNTAECSCPTDDHRNYYLANNGKECIVDNGQDRCSSNQYTCPNGDCKPIGYVCDGYIDCPSETDESARVCADNTCPPHVHRCPSGKCIPVSWLCDFDDDCGDGSDEINCDQPTCASDEFTCATSRCISQDEVCNGFDNCRDGQISDEQDCPFTTCRPNYHKCNATNLCIPKSYLCDGDDDCQDNSDENPLFCRDKTCSPGDFQCANKHKCIPSYWYCDDYQDCSDGSDEPAIGCDHPSITCPAGSFKCDNGQCVNTDWICDGENDCGDNSDEDSRQDCGSRTCESDEFTCTANPPGYSRCIPSYYVCDGEPDCNDASDELQDCPQRNCTDGEFACKNGLCIYADYTCDHNNDCGDYSDEYPGCVYQTCAYYQFTCESGKCIYNWDVCDGFDDCGDGSDEEDCSTADPTCPSGQFTCLNGDCIDQGLVCDRNSDCSDKSDELRCGLNECAQIESNQCAQICVDEPTSYHCECQPGYRLMPDGKACADIDECMETPEVCSQLCDNTEGSYYCKCGNGYLREPDQKTCRQNSGINPYLLFSNRYYIRNITTTGSNYQLVSQGHTTIVALDYHYGDKTLFWSDVSRGDIQSMKFDGSDRKVLLSRDVPNVEGIAVEWVTRKLYWVDATVDALFVSELNGTSMKTLMKDCIDANGTYCFDQPRAVVVHPKRGTIYWTDWGVNPYIARAGLNGIEATPVVTYRISWPNALTIDYVTERLYWGDAHIDVIEFSDLNGTNRHILDMRHAPPHPFSMTFFESYIYWTDWNTLSMYKAHGLDGSNLQVLVNTTHRPYDTHIVHPYRQDPTLTNPCAVDNGGCSHLCLMHHGGEGRECKCPDNFASINVGLNSHRCVPQCSSAEYRCDSIEKCIPVYWQCDGVKDCPDGSDEPDTCPPRHCQPGLFQCNNFECVYPEYICDGRNDCTDGSDESNFDCSDYACTENQFKCANGKCLTNSRVCDGNDDCGDGSDEKQDMCNARTCPPGNFQCDNKRCIPSNWYCDVDDDCGDGSDEPSAICHGPTHRCDEHSEFACKTNYRCIPTWAVCNGNDDCYDNSDEEGCEERTCHPTGDFRCDNHECIPLRWECDGFNDCSDGSDERNCGSRDCTESEFRCDNKNCIPQRWRCNQYDNCGDGSDERGCTALTCQPDYFECKSGHCVPGVLTCNGDRDCLDASDEDTCAPRFPDGKYCPPNVFECDNHVCINNNLRCDGRDHCGDNSDEFPVVCESIECNSPNYRCEKTRICIFGSKVCDGYDDCGDGSDEDLDMCHVTTPASVCTPGQFKCLNGKCISDQMICDDVDQCGDQSDEIGCHKGDTDQTCSDKPCEQTCTNIPVVGEQPGFYLCSCRSGFKVNLDDTHTCLDIDECKENWDICPQICNNLKGSYQCDCMEGYEKSGTNKCSAIGFSVHLVADEQEVKVYDSANEREYDLIDDQIRTRAIDYAYIEGNSSVVYWTDTASFTDSSGTQTTKPKIVRTLMPYADGSTNNRGRSQVLNIDELKQPNGLAVDWVAKNLYWTDAMAGTLSVSLLDGRYRSIIFSKLDTPHAIAVNPEYGYMYWTTLGFSPGVYRSHMDGGDKKMLEHIVVAYPTGITIDYQNDGRLYISDQEGNMIISTDKRGQDAKFVARGGIGSPVSVEVFENTVFWTSLDDKTIYRQEKFGRGVKTTLRSGFVNPTGVKVFQQYRQATSVTNRCKPGSCSHLCLLSPGSYTCACPQGTSFVPGSARQCDASYEAEVQPLQVCQCRNGATCLYDSDGVPSCICPPGYSGLNCEVRKDAHIGGSVDTGTIIGIVIGIIVVAALLAAAFTMYRKKGNKSFDDLSLPTLSKPSLSSCCPGFQKESATSAFDNPITYHPSVDDEYPSAPVIDSKIAVDTTSGSFVNPSFKPMGKSKSSDTSPTSPVSPEPSTTTGVVNPGFSLKLTGSSDIDSQLVKNDFSDV